MDKNQIRISKLLSLVLRHQPEAIGLTLDSSGWANIDKLVQLIQQSGKRINREQLLNIVDNDTKSRYAISEDGTLIRANQGHSIDIELGLSPIKPPDTLFHGTVKRFLESIMKSGLEAGSRQFVHLSLERQTATEVGKRRGKPIVLSVRTAAMHFEGFKFYRSANGVWLTEHVPVTYIEFP